MAVTGINPDEKHNLVPPQDVEDLYFLAPWVVRNRTAFFAPDVSQHPVSESHGERLKEVGIKALISWPIIDANDRILGVLHLVGTEPREISNADRNFFETVASLFALLLRRKQTEEALRLSEANYRSIFENIQDAFFRVSLDGRLEMLNPSGVRLLGYESADEIIGTLVAETVYYNSADRLTYLEIMSRDGCLKNLDIPLRRKDGSRVMLEINAYIRYDSENRPIAMEGILRDIRQRKKLEEESLKAQKLESIGLLAGGLAHDFNNILTAIMGNIGLARNLLPTDSKVSHRLARAEDACLRARDINQQLLTFSKGGKPMKQLSDVARLLNQTSGFSLRGSNVKCEIEIPEDLWPAEIDQGQISQAIHNLIINAVQAMPDGGLLRILAQNVTKRDEQNLCDLFELDIRIEDNGTGMDPDTIARAFDPYFSTKSTGTGLGLTTVYSIVQNHGGSITIQSEPGKGSTFIIRIPALPGSSPFDQLNHIALQPNHIALQRIHGRVLLMDDDVTILEMARSLFSDIEMDLECAIDGFGALEIYTRALEENKRFDLVVIDLTIPGGLGGLETMKRLLIIDPEVRAIVSSGYSNDPIMAQYDHYGFIGCLRKPYQINDLFQTITKFMQKDQTGDGPITQ